MHKTKYIPRTVGVGEKLSRGVSCSAFALVHMMDIGSVHWAMRERSDLETIIARGLKTIQKLGRRTVGRGQFRDFLHQDLYGEVVSNSPNTLYMYIRIHVRKNKSARLSSMCV